MLRTFIGIGTISSQVYHKGGYDPIYVLWANMLRRCYDPNHLARRPSYLKVYVCYQWHSYECFREWALSQDREGKVLDKDIKKPGCNLYSPDTCLFVTKEINSLFTGYQIKKDLPAGISVDRRWNIYRVRVSFAGKTKQVSQHKELADAINSLIVSTRKKIDLLIRSIEDDSLIAYINNFASYKENLIKEQYGS